MAEAPRTITRAEVAGHAKKADCWIVIDNAVLDVTAFLDDHPGGPETVVALAGQDATAQWVMAERRRHSPSSSRFNAFFAPPLPAFIRRFEDTGHSKSARDMLKKYTIGVVPEEERRIVGGPVKPGGGGGDESSSGLTWIVYAIPAVIVLLAVLYQYGLIGGGAAAARK